MSKNYSIYFFKIISTLFVVGIHSFVFYSVDVNIYTILMALFSIAVPFFFIASGYLMYISLNKRKNSKEQQIYLLKYLLNLLSVYIIYTLIDGLLIYMENYYILNTKVDILRWIFSKETLLGLHIGGYFYSIWFLMTLIHSHLIIYYLKSKIELVVCFSSLIYICLYSLQATGIIGVSRNVFTVGLLFTSLGYLIAKYKEIILNYFKNKNNNLLILINLLFFIWLVIEVKLIYLNLNMTLTSYLILIPLIIINFIILLKNPNKLKNNKIEFLGRNTFGVYLLHSFILRLIYLLFNYYNIPQHFISNIFVFIIFIIMVYIISYFLYYTPIYIVKKIKNKLNFKKKLS